MKHVLYICDIKRLSSSCVFLQISSHTDRSVALKVCAHTICRREHTAPKSGNLHFDCSSFSSIAISTLLDAYTFRSPVFPFKLLSRNVVLMLTVFTLQPTLHLSSSSVYTLKPQHFASYCSSFHCFPLTFLHQNLFQYCHCFQYLKQTSATT